MAVRLSPLAKRQVEDIWLYTEDAWGEDQANGYVNGLFGFLETLPHKKHLWRAVPRESLRGAFCAPYREHIVFFRQLSGQTIGVLAVPHQRQDIPHRLRELLDDDGSDG